ncbi:MAG: hypothetical protein J0I21_11895 [Alphaproteobacteria bacterium]|nr:hypothetical protein [Alphaproteobacteria bacterium]
MRKVLGMAAAATLTLAFVQGAFVQGAVAQERRAAVLPVAAEDSSLDFNAQQDGNAPAPRFSLFGLPVAINSPVTAPYCNCALNTFGGQPMNGQDSVRALGRGVRG